VLSRLVAAGKLERVARGVYGVPSVAISEHRSLAEVALRVPQGVVCLLSALRVHGIGTQAPFEVWLAIGHRAPIPKLDQPKIRHVRMSGAAFTDGIEHLVVDCVSVPVFNAAKTVADCFKYRNKIGLDVAMEALRDGWAQRKFTMDDIWQRLMMSLLISFNHAISTRHQCPGCRFPFQKRCQQCPYSSSFAG
jgi:predicted transcriptional regulator of viral defense system